MSRWVIVVLLIVALYIFWQAPFLGVMLAIGGLIFMCRAFGGWLLVESVRKLLHRR